MHAFVTATREALMNLLRRPQRPSQTPEMRVARGERAEAALEHDVMAEALQEVNLNYVEQMVNTGPEDAETREYLHHRIAALQDVMLELHGYVQMAEALRAEAEMREAA